MTKKFIFKKKNFIELSIKQNKMTNDCIEIHKIHAKITKLRKWQADALQEPTFSPSVSDQFSKILEKIRVIDEQNKFSITNNRLLVDKIIKYIPELVELSHKNYLQTAIIDLQTKLSTVYTQVVKLSELASAVPSSRGKVVSQLKQIMSRAFMISYYKVSTTVFTTIQQMLVTVTNELSKLGSGAWKEFMPQFPNLITQINDVDGLLKHLMAAHAFIFTAESLQNSLRRVQQKNPGIQLPLKSHHIFIEPHKPSAINLTEPSLISPNLGQIDELVKQIKSDPENIDELIQKLESCIHHEFKFVSPAVIIQQVLTVTFSIHPPIDLKSKLFSKTFLLFKDLTASIQSLCQLPDFVYSKSEISNFEQLINNVEKTVDSISKARKKPSGWTADKTKLMIKKFEDYILICKNVILAAETVENINTSIDPHKISIDLTKFRLNPVESRFTIADYPRDHKTRYITIMRALNIISEDVINLESKGYIFRDPKLQTREFHSVSFKNSFDHIQKITEKLESDVFRFSLSQFNEFPVSKSGVTILSIFAEMQRMLEQNLLSMHEVPIQALNFRLLSMCLFELGFPLSTNEFIDEVLNELDTLYDSYVMFGKLEEVGAISINNCAQICFLITLCDELSSYNEEVFSTYRDYFLSINLFEIDVESTLQHILSLQKDTMKVLDNWSCSSIVSKFTQYTKTIYTCSTQLKRSPPVEPLLTKLLTQLSSWLGNLSRTLPKPTNLREMQIRMSVLHQMFTNFLETNPDMKKQIPFEQLTEVINLFKDLRNIFSIKARLKQLLGFLERIQTNPDESISIIETGSSVNESEASSNEDEMDGTEKADGFVDNQKSSNEQDESISIRFTPAEMGLWESFSPTILNPTYLEKKKEFLVNYLSPKLIYTHFNDLVTKYCEMWRLEEAFSQEIEQSFRSMLDQDVELTIQGLFNFFNSNNSKFISFRDKMTIHIEQHLETIIKSLTEFAPAPRGRGFQRELPPAHPNAPEIADVIKGLQSLSQNITGTDFSWYPELVRLYHQLNPLLGEMSISSDGNHPSSMFRRLCRKAYLCFLVTRCFHIFSNSCIPYGPDLESLRCLIADFMEDPTLANDNTAMMRNQIEDIMNSDIGSDTFVFESSMKSLRKACSLINLNAIVDLIEADFFNFDEFFSKLPPNVSSLSTLISSSLFEAVEAAKKQLFVLVCMNYEDGIAQECVMSLQTFISEVSKAPFEVDKMSISNSIKACRILQSLSDVSTTFDCLDVFTPKQNDDNLMNGSWVLRVRILLIALDKRIKTLMSLSGDQFRSIFKLFRPVMTAIDKVPNNFGFVDASMPAFEELRASWKNLCDCFQPVNLIPQWVRFKQISKSIPSVFQSSINNPDIQALSQKAQKFDVTHDPDDLIQLKLVFLFLEKQVKRYIIGNEYVIFPFYELQNILTILLKFNEVCLLIPEVTDRINSMNIGEPITTPEIFQINDTEPFQDEDEGKNKETSESNENENENSIEPILGKPISFEDQVQLSQMIDATSDANAADEEKRAQIPFIEHQVKCLEPFINRSKESNKNLRGINEYFSEPIKAIKAKMTDEGKSQTRIDEMIELNKLKAQEKVEEDQSESAQLYFDKLNKSCSEAGITLEKNISTRRMKRFELDYMRESLQIDKIELSLNKIDFKEKMMNENREKLKILSKSFTDLCQDSAENEKKSEKEIENSSPDDDADSLDLIDPVVIGCDDLSAMNKQMKKKAEIIKKAVVDEDESLNLSKEELIHLRDNLKKENDKKKSEVLTSMSNIFV